jgi:hypothetical protein
LGWFLSEWQSITPPPSSLDIVTLTNGDKVQGKIIKQEYPKYVVVEVAPNERKAVAWEEIQLISEKDPPFTSKWETISGVLDSLSKLGVLAGILVFGFGFWQYWQAQKWKRIEFLLGEVKVFNAHPKVQTAKLMLDSFMLHENGRKIKLYPDRQADAMYEDVSNEETLHALSIRQGVQADSEKEKLIADSFDVFLSWMENFNSYIESKLVTPKEVRLHVEYWLGLIGDAKKPLNYKPEFRKVLLEYAERYGFTGVKKLLNKYEFTATKPRWWEFWKKKEKEMPPEENLGTGGAKPEAAPPFKRIMLIANKKWEADPLVNVLLEKRACPMKFDFPPDFLKHPLPPNTDWQMPHPRAIISFKEKIDGQDKEIAQIEVWCVEDWMDPKANKSSTNEKVRILPRLFEWDGRAKPDFVAAFGTAGFISQTSYNGCVVVGANAFIHNAFSKDKPNPESPWDDSGITRPIEATLDTKKGFFNPQEIDTSVRYQAEARFIAPPLNPARDLVIIAAHNYTALGVVNVTNYDDYIWADRAAIDAFQAARTGKPIGSVETTHSVIRIKSEAPFIFISGIVDREDSFNMEVSPRVYAQNLVSAHNAGVAVAWLIPHIVRLVK